MLVYKFGGASVKDADGIRNLAKIVSRIKENLVIVVSAFGKTTNALEKVLKDWMAGDQGYRDSLDKIHDYHDSVISGLFTSPGQVRQKIDNYFVLLREYLESAKKEDYDFEYDQVVSYGEIWSTVIVENYLRKSGLNSKWIDIRGNLITDDRYRDADILWYESNARIRGVFSFRKHDIYVTQGFIGSTVSGLTTTLGREGSDYTAALIGNILEAREVVVWKDVPGLLNVDPKWFPDAKKIDEISYREAVEMTFSGAKVIHPKTIKPLHNKNIPLHVKSFMAPEEKGTTIRSDEVKKHGLPVYIKKENQIMISMVPRDLSFAMGENLSRIFFLFARHGIKVNLVDASAVSINICADDDRVKVNGLVNDLSTEFSIVYNDDVEMLSIRHYTKAAVKRLTEGRKILLEQRTRSTVRYVAKKN